MVVRCCNRCTRSLLDDDDDDDDDDGNDNDDDDDDDDSYTNTHTRARARTRTYTNYSLQYGCRVVIMSFCRAGKFVVKKLHTYNTLTYNLLTNSSHACIVGRNILISIYTRACMRGKCTRGNMHTHTHIHKLLTAVCSMAVVY